MTVQIADSDEKILKCRKALLDLRPHINEDEFPDIIRRMIKDGYCLIYVEDNNEAASVAGFFTGYKLHRGNYLYIDDLNTLPTFRKMGYAEILMKWIVNYAKQNNVDQIHLDSGVQRFDAHRFYLKQGFDITSHHFAMKVIR
ncbi:MAG TPA: GNAT family N-acetyltransferase [Bacteroidia bacterium]|nr:GNAT family N-acetyltransferase [Bacteroidia bacterium]